MARTVDQEQHGFIAGVLYGRSEVVHRLHRLTIHLFDDVTGLQAGCRRAALRLHLFDDEAVRILRRAYARRQLRR